MPSAASFSRHSPISAWLRLDDWGWSDGPKCPKSLLWVKNPLDGLSSVKSTRVRFYTAPMSCKIEKPFQNLQDRNDQGFGFTLEKKKHVWILLGPTEFVKTKTNSKIRMLRPK